MRDYVLVRIVVLGPGAAGKSTFSRELAAATGAAWVEIDSIFWQPGLKPLSHAASPSGERI